MFSMNYQLISDNGEILIIEEVPVINEMELPTHLAKKGFNIHIKLLKDNKEKVFFLLGFLGSCTH